MNEEEGYLLPTWAQKITLAMFWLNASVVIMQAKSLPMFWLSKHWQVIFQAHGGNILTFLYITHNHVWYAVTSQMNGLILAGILESLLCIFPYMYLLVCASLRLLHRKMNSILRLIQRVYIYYVSLLCVILLLCVFCNNSWVFALLNVTSIPPLAAVDTSTSSTVKEQRQLIV